MLLASAASAARRLLNARSRPLSDLERLEKLPERLRLRGVRGVMLCGVMLLGDEVEKVGDLTFGRSASDESGEKVWRGERAFMRGRPDVREGEWDLIGRDIVDACGSQEASTRVAIRAMSECRV